MPIMMWLGDHWVRHFRSEVVLISISPASSHDVWNNQVRTCEGYIAKASGLLLMMQGSYHTISLKSDTRNIIPVLRN